MNGNWFPWSEGVNGNGAGPIRRRLAPRPRHLRRGRRDQRHLGLVPNVDPGGSLVDIATQYPGDAYVDWTGLDGYNWGTNPASPKGWRSFDQLFSSTYEKITEVDRALEADDDRRGRVQLSTAARRPPGSRTCSKAVPTEYPQIRALLWFDKFDDGMDWPIETSRRRRAPPSRRASRTRSTWATPTADSRLGRSSRRADRRRPVGLVPYTCSSAGGLRSRSPDGVARDRRQAEFSMPTRTRTNKRGAGQGPCPRRTGRRLPAPGRSGRTGDPCQAEIDLLGRLDRQPADRRRRLHGT